MTLRELLDFKAPVAVHAIDTALGVLLGIALMWVFG